MKESTSEGSSTIIMIKFSKITTFGIVIATLVVAGFSVWFFNPERDTKKLETIKQEKQQEVQKTPEITTSQPNDLSKIEYSRVELLENCANAEIPLTGERNTVYNSEKKTLEVSFWNGELQEDVLVVLPYEPETDFAGCSDSVKDILRHVQELNEENIRSGKE